MDVGTACLASISIVCQGRVLRQLYFGRDVAQRKRDICIRRSRLQSKADKGHIRAKHALQGLRGYEQNFDRARCYQIAHQIVALAKRYRGTIAIEDLNGLRDSKLGRKANRKVKRMPYVIFRRALQSIAWQNGIEVTAVPANHTSKTCSKCGKEGVRSSDNWAWFRCPHCGYRVNADRNASVNIASRLAKLLSERRERMTAISLPDFREWTCSNPRRPSRCGFVRVLAAYPIDPMENLGINPRMVTGHTFWRAFRTAAPRLN